jgi:hypothetical protein
MSIKIKANHVVNNTDNDMNLCIWEHSIVLSDGKNEYKFRQKQNDNFFEFDEMSETSSCKFSAFESQLSNIKFHYDKNELKIEFLSPYQECLKEFIMIFDSVKIRYSCDCEVNISACNINISNMSNYIKYVGRDVNYCDAIVFDPYVIPESKHKVHMYCDIVLSTHNTNNKLDKYLLIDCSSASMVVTGRCDSIECREIIKKMCLDLRNFIDPRYIGANGTLDGALSRDEFHFSNGGEGIITDINTLQYYAILLKNYFPTLKLKIIRIGTNIEQSISINRNLMGKSASNTQLFY